jgi:hypothetical protein
MFDPNLPFAKLAKLFRGTVNATAYDEIEACKGAFTPQHKALKRVLARGLRSRARQIRDLFLNLSRCGDLDFGIGLVSSSRLAAFDFPKQQ